MKNRTEVGGYVLISKSGEPKTLRREDLGLSAVRWKKLLAIAKKDGQVLLQDRQFILIYEPWKHSDKLFK
jgi:hypothetical protein